jgi:hypothetical protein
VPCVDFFQAACSLFLFALLLFACLANSVDIEMILHHFQVLVELFMSPAAK